MKWSQGRWNELKKEPLVLRNWRMMAKKIEAKQISAFF
jgi:hypothetical protein